MSEHYEIEVRSRSYSPWWRLAEEGTRFETPEKAVEMIEALKVKDREVNQDRQWRVVRVAREILVNGEWLPA